MKVKELINVLEKYDPNLPVILEMNLEHSDDRYDDWVRGANEAQEVELDCELIIIRDFNS